MYRSIELDSTDKSNGLSGGEVLGDSIYEMCCIDAYRNKDIQRCDLSNGYWDQATMRIMNQEVAAKRSCCVIIDTTRAICHIAHDQCCRAGTELSENV